MTASASKRTPCVGQTVHYQSYGTPGGEYLPEPRAAIITEVKNFDPVPQHGVPYVSLCVVNPTGLFFKEDLPFAEEPTPGHWNYMPRNESCDPIRAIVDDFVQVIGLGGEVVAAKACTCGPGAACSNCPPTTEPAPDTCRHCVLCDGRGQITPATGLIPVKCPDCGGTGQRTN